MFYCTLPALPGKQPAPVTDVTRARFCFVVDELALYRCVGSSEVMTAQRLKLREVAAMPLVTLQVPPAGAHIPSGFIVADDAAAYAEHARMVGTLGRSGAAQSSNHSARLSPVGR